MASPSQISSSVQHVLKVDAGEWSTTIIAFGEARSRQEQISSLSHELERRRPRLSFLLTEDPALDAARLLLFLHHRTPLALIDPGIGPGRFHAMLSAYEPEFVLGCTDPKMIASDYVQVEELPSAWSRTPSRVDPHPDLALLLSTSGSTGSPKFVRLSHANIKINAQQITETLDIDTSMRAALVLPLHYSFGMSVVTSHALAGATLVAPSEGVMSQSFWTQVSAASVTFLPGVPQSLAMLERLDFARLKPPTIKVLAQAGGKLPDESIRYFHDVMSTASGRFHVMYGQTEASPRIACLPANSLPAKLGSVGIAVPGGHIEIVDEHDCAVDPLATGEIRYSGPNVMMGYAEELEDLAVGDVQGDSLKTGDLGFLDHDGYLYLTGRTKRIAKIASARVSLDEVEAEATQLAGSPVAVLPGALDGISVIVEGSPEAADALRRTLARVLRVPPAMIRSLSIDQLPLLSSGKIDYLRLEQTLRQGPAE